MRVLHVSDLHVTDKDETLENLWTGVAAQLRAAGPDAKFDVVVVSGDLTQRAATEEYDRVRDFLRERLLSLLATESTRHVVIVPGNHDVNWDAIAAKQLSLDDFGTARPDELKEAVADARTRRGLSSFRLRQGGLGHGELWKIDEEQYGQRFANFNKFLQDFYGTEEKTNADVYRSFRFDAPGEDWSAHVFPKEKIAFFGFNSAYRTDKFWTGALIDISAIERARLWMEQHAADCLPVAVWHHGPSSDEAGIDYLPPRNLAQLSNAKFVVGFHGHTHRAALQQIGDQMFAGLTLIGTGSYGAGTKERPPTVGRQFSIVRLYHRQVQVTKYSANQVDTYVAEPQPIRLLRFRDDHHLTHPQAVLHERTYEVDELGRAWVTVRLVGLEAQQPFAVGVVQQPYCAVCVVDPEGREHASVVVKSSDLSGKTRLTVSPPGSVDGLDADPSELTASFGVSASFALTQEDVRRRDDRRPGTERNLGLNEDARPHNVRVLCDELRMKVLLPAGSIEPTSVKAMVERQTADGRWSVDDDEQKRCEIIDATDRGGTLITHGPIMGYRYSLRYAVARPGLVLDGAAQELLAELLANCRYGFTEQRAVGEPPVGPQFRDLLTRAVETQLAKAGGSALNLASAGTRWMGLLWSEERKRLLPAFGQFSPCSWAVAFANGAGVAGHAFRFGAIARWHQAHGGRESLIYQEQPEGRDRPDDHDFIVCIPLRIGREGPPVGVVSIEGKSLRNHDLRELAAFARAESLADRSAPTDWEEVVNAAFWSVCESAPDAESLPPAERPRWTKGTKTVIEAAGKGWTDGGSETEAERTARAPDEPA